MSLEIKGILITKPNPMLSPSYQPGSRNRISVTVSKLLLCVTTLLPGVGPSHSTWDPHPFTFRCEPRGYTLSPLGSPETPHLSLDFQKCAAGASSGLKSTLVLLCMIHRSQLQKFLIKPFLPFSFQPLGLRLEFFQGWQGKKKKR